MDNIRVSEVTMKRDRWIWMGHAGHLCVADSCRFKLNTFVGRYIVSTVGEYYSANETKMQTLGAGDKTFYETMVFKARKSIQKCCPYQAVICGEVEVRRYETAEEAQKGHLKLCEIWSKQK